MMRSVPGDPERLGGYWLAGRLGAGRHGVVYDAYDDEGRRFAVRVPRGPLPRVRPVTHPHLASVLEVRSGGTPAYVVSEFASGPSLREAISLHGPYAGEELVALATAVASALACLHGAGLAHGDLRPGKVLLTGDGPKVICPGVPGSIGGTRTYLAPPRSSRGSRAARRATCSPGARWCCSRPRATTRSAAAPWARSCTGCCPATPT
ncbi:protein kinase [Nonomuraea ferruginea]